MRLNKAKKVPGQCSPSVKPDSCIVFSNAA